MPRKTLVLIISLFVLSIVLFALALSQNTQSVVTAKPAPSITTSPKTPTKSELETRMFFSPNPAIVESKSKVTLTLFLQTTIKQITGVNLALSYDPADLNFVSLQPSGIFSDTSVIFSDVDKQKGNINYTIGITPQQSPINGSGDIIALTFTKRAATQADKTTVTFLENTIISARGQKDFVLKNHEDSIIKLEAP